MATQRTPAAKDDIARALKACYAEPDLHLLLTEFAKAIKYAHMRSPLPWCWEVTMWPDDCLIRFNVSAQTKTGKEYIRIATNGDVMFFVEREALKEETRQVIARMYPDVVIKRWERQSQKRDYVIIPRSLISHLHAIYQLIEEAHHAMLERYTQWTLNREYRSWHSRGIIDFMREMLNDQSIPNPDDPKLFKPDADKSRQLMFPELHPAREPDEVQEAYDTAAEQAGKVMSGRGFRMSAVERAAIEGHAMRMAQQHYESQGWTVDPSVAKSESYDLRCTRDGMELRVEVKGTTSKRVGFNIR